MAEWASAAQKVNELGPLLELPLPEYRLVPAGAPAPAGLVDCTALFPRTAIVRTLIEPGGLFRDAVDTAAADPTAAFVQVGHVRARLGKKVAKEECARVVLASELVRRAAEKRGMEVVDGVLL
ncbi:MAG: hypothetical protein M1826_005262 [Phylliscum demangeonii]|nr:MAG: hypothetical protein M1826_005262 [Phylliscum demangeonii]